MKTRILILLAIAISTRVPAQTITISNNCLDMVKQMTAYNDARMYDSVLAVYPVYSKKCTAKDAKFKGGTQLARAYNGLGKYNEALTAANGAIKANKTLIAAIYERAVAYAGLGRLAESKADYQSIVELSEKNRDQASRSSILSMLAYISFKQGLKDEAFKTIDEAIALEARPAYYIQKGDMYYAQENYGQAFVLYDQAVAAGDTGYEMYALRFAQRLRIYQRKYGTTNVQNLAGKMTAQEKRACCNELDKLRAFGRKDMTMDMTYAFLCE